MTLSRASRRPTRRRRPGVGVAAAALLSLTAVSGCGSHLTPGVAATINGDTISQDSVDSVVEAACAYTAASAQTGAAPQPPISLANLRSTITQSLIQFEVTDDAATQMGLSVSPAVIATGATQQPIPAGLDDTDADVIKGFFADFAKSSAQIQLIGAHLADPSITTYEQVTLDKSAQGKKYVTTYAADQDVTVNPAYGSWNGSAVAGGSGSLSDPVSDSAKASAAGAADGANTSSLPSSQVC